MKMVSEGKYEPGEPIGEIQIEKVNYAGSDEYLIKMRTQKGKNKVHEHTVKFTQNGINALLGTWMAVTGNNFD